jgi:ABC-type enterochelin transport system substrate-binding protein
VVHASPITTEAIRRIGALYGIEEEVRGKPAELRREIRQARANRADAYKWTSLAICKTG